MHLCPDFQACARYPAIYTARCQCQTYFLLYKHAPYVAGLVTRTWDKRAFKRLPRVAAKKCELKNYTHLKFTLFTYSLEFVPKKFTCADD